MRIEVTYRNRGPAEVVIPRKYLIEWPMVSLAFGCPADWDDERIMSRRISADLSGVRLAPGDTLRCLLQTSRLYPVGLHRERLQVADPRMAKLINPKTEGQCEFEVRAPQGDGVAGHSPRLEHNRP